MQQNEPDFGSFLALFSCILKCESKQCHLKTQCSTSPWFGAEVWSGEGVITLFLALQGSL